MRLTLAVWRLLPVIMAAEMKINCVIQLVWPRGRVSTDGVISCGLEVGFPSPNWITGKHTINIIIKTLGEVRNIISISLAY